MLQFFLFLLIFPLSLKVGLLLSELFLQNLSILPQIIGVGKDVIVLLVLQIYFEG